MLMKILILGLVTAIFATGANLNVFANTVINKNNQNLAITVDNNDETKSSVETKKTNDDFRKQILKKDNSSLNLTEKDNLSSYDKSKNKGKGFSTGTKIAIGVGIAAVVVGVFVFAASRDKIKYNGYGF